MFKKKKITFEKKNRRWGLRCPASDKGKWSRQTMSFRPNPFHKKCSLNAYNILFVPKKASQGTVAHLTSVTVIARKHSLQYYTLLILLTESKANLSRAVTRQHKNVAQ